MLRRLWWFILLLVACAATAAAHPPVDAVAAVRISPAGELSISLTHDALAFALNDTSRNIPDEAMFALLASPDEALARSLAEAQDRFATLCTLLADGARVPLTVTASPTVEQVREWQHRRRSYPLPIKLELQARAVLPSAAHTLQIKFPEMLGDVILSLERPGEEALALPLGAGELSPEFSLASHANSAGDASATAPPDPQSAAPPEPRGTWPILQRFTALGFTHIIPHGPDHCLFVLGLFLLNPRLKPVLYQITAFTIAHTATLTLTTLGIIGLPSVLVEPTLAASVAFIGIENLLTTRVHPWRPAVAFLFGLVHGMGVAAAFSEANFPKGQLIPSLAAFTLGVEAGHIAVLAAAFLTLGWFSTRVWFRGRITIPLSHAIALIAAAWFVQRLAAA